MKISIRPPKGTPSVFGITNELWTPLQHGNNIAVYSAADILAKVLAGTSTFKVNTIYFEFSNSTPPSVTPTRSGAKAYYTGLTAPQDFVRAPIIADPTFLASGSDYVSNVVTFLSSTKGIFVGAKNGLPFTVGASSQVYGFALVSAPVPTDMSQDTVFARFYNMTPITKTSNQEIGVSWPVEMQ